MGFILFYIGLFSIIAAASAFTSLLLLCLYKFVVRVRLLVRTFSNDVSR